jgi:F-type H+-transporting ATPase subunit b
MLNEAETWVAIAFFAFVGVMIYFRVHTRITDGLDSRTSRIKAELDEAVRLKDEAKALLAEYERRGKAAEQEAAGILEGAKAEAGRIAAEAKTKMEEYVTRRTKMAETKISQAETQAIADVRAAAADAAVAAAEKILSQKVKAGVADNLIAKGIAELKSKLN